MRPELKRAPEMFADGVDGERISHFGDRFAYYAKRVRALDLNQDYDHSRYVDYRVVHPTVLLAWGRHQHLFPRLSTLTVCGQTSLDPARDEQVFGRFIRSPHLTSLIVTWVEELCKLSQESVNALVDACARLERVQLGQAGCSLAILDEGHPLPRLLHRMTEGAGRLRSLEMTPLNMPIQFATLVCLAAMPTLQHAVLRSILSVPVVFRLPASPFSALRTLCITDTTPHLHLTRSILQSCTSPHLAVLHITIADPAVGSYGNSPHVSDNDLGSLLGLVSRRLSLTSLRLRFNLTLMINTDLCYMLPPLPHLTWLRMSGSFGPILNTDTVRHVLALYPQLEEWAYHTSRLYAAVTFSEFLELLQPRSMIRALPVVVASTELPSEEALSQFGTITCWECLYVMDGVDTPEVLEVIDRILPNVVIEVCE
jgi:hypothetical protein